MMAAGRAAELGARVVLIEKNRATGRKLLITGGGRCNVTTAIADRHALVSRYGRGAQALHSVFARFTPDDMRAFLSARGLETVVEPEERVFPVTHRASSVHRALLGYLEGGSVEIRTGCAARALCPATDPGTRIEAVELADGSRVVAGRFILATGGVSRPETGSTGDGLRWLASLGISVRVPEPSLVPIRVSEAWPLALQGVALADVKVTALLDGERQFEATGKLLFTHFGLSGPLILNLSQRINELAQGGPVVLCVDLFPRADGGSLDRRLQEVVRGAPRRLLGNAIGAFAPARVGRALLDLASVDAARPSSELTRAERGRIVGAAKSMPITFAGLLGTDRAVVSSGGVDPADVDFTTMTLKRARNLAVVGDLLDFDRQSGGFSLQLCWSSGWVAGTAASEDASAAESAAG